MCKEELRDGPGTLTERVGLRCGEEESEEELVGRDLVEGEEHVTFKVKPKFTLAEGVQLAGAGWN